ncbi:MAG: hypothetical protein AABY22_25715, partial [Nanoarchaeota archaeon]
LAPAAFFLSFIHNKIQNKIPGFRLRYLLIIILIFNLIWLGGFGKPLNTGNSIYLESTEGKLIAEKSLKINENAFVVYDARIFRGIAYWIFHDRNFIESSLLSQVMEESKKYGDQQINSEVYFIECVIDDCGWGTIKNQPDFNKSVEDLIQKFKNISSVVAEISGPGYGSNSYFPGISTKENILRYRIYKTQTILPVAVFPLARSTHNFLLYPIGYDRSFGPLFDDYEINGFFDKSLHNLALYILYASLILSLLSSLLLFYLLINQEEKS